MTILGSLLSLENGDNKKLNQHNRKNGEDE